MPEVISTASSEQRWAYAVVTASPMINEKPCAFKDCIKPCRCCAESNVYTGMSDCNTPQISRAILLMLGYATMADLPG